MARQFTPEQLAGIETGLAQVYSGWLALLPAAVRAPLITRAPTIDLDATDIEVYGAGKQQIGWTYAGVRAGRVHLASWAGAELPLAADLIAGNADVRPDAPALLRRALAVLPAAVCARPRLRADAGYFDVKLAIAAREAGVDFAIAAKRNTAAWRAYAGIEAAAWQPARDMSGAQVAACDYAPAGWPPGSYTITRRVRIEAAEISTDPRARRRRTIPAEQLRLALSGDADHAYAVSFIVTDIPADDRDLAGLEAWFRGRVSIEERFREAKLGAGLFHLPSADRTVNTMWTWAALLAGALNVMLAGLTGPQPNACATPAGSPPRHPAPQPARHPRPAHPARPRPHPATTAPPQRRPARPDPATRAAHPRLLTHHPRPDNQDPETPEPSRPNRHVHV